MLLHHQLANEITGAIQSAQASEALPTFELPEIKVTRPRDPTHGEYASAIALQVVGMVKKATGQKMAPIKVARTIVEHLPKSAYIDEIMIAPPGFINIRLSTHWLQNQINVILSEGKRFGTFEYGKGKKVQIECVSANPTGPITLGRTRGGVMGDTLARAMRLAGYDVTLEYYYNDAGNQVMLLGETLKIRYQQALGDVAELTEGKHYKGAYIIDLARELVAEHGDALLDKPTDYFSDYAKERISAAQKESLARINIVFDVYYREQSLYESGRVWEALETLQQNGYVYEKEGAQWLKTTAFGDNEDRVLVKEDGTLTYRMPDIAYHWHKAQRGFDVVVDFFGPDHHATAPQVLMGVQALGYETSFVQTVLHQVVSLIRDGKKVKMSTREGVYVTLDELVEEVGADPIRYFMNARSGNSHVDFDLDLALEQSDKNPVYYIQNAHVRCAGILRKWQEAGHDLALAKTADLSYLTHENELKFLRKAQELGQVIEVMVKSYEPHHIAFYAYDLAAVFHPTYETCRVLHSDVPEPVRLARLQFYMAAKRLFAHVLALMGMSAPEVM